MRKREPKIEMTSLACAERYREIFFPKYVIYIRKKHSDELSGCFFRAFLSC